MCKGGGGRALPSVLLGRGASHVEPAGEAIALNICIGGAKGMTLRQDCFRVARLSETKELITQ